MKIPRRDELTEADWRKAEEWFNSGTPGGQLEHIMDLYYNKVMLPKKQKKGR